jgi:hypothetical protein
MWLLAGSASAQEAPDPWDWAQGAQDTAWATIKKAVPGFTDQGSPDEWSVVVIAEDGWGRTGEFRFWKSPRGPAGVAYVRTVGDNLLGQLHALREKASDLSVDAATPLLSVRAGTLLATDCGGLTPLAARFQKLRIQALPAGYLALHVPGYSVSVTAAFRGEQRYLVDTNENNLARWCATLQETVLRCERAR